jgi:protein-tyrosine kinase
MSRIFDAVRRGQGEIAATVLGALEKEIEEQAQFANSEPFVPQSITIEAIPLTVAMPALTSIEPVPTTVSIVEKELNDVVAAPQTLVKQLQSKVRTVPFQVSANSPLLPFDTANWRASEQYRTIRTRIIQDTRQPQVVLITSSGAGDGKSITSINVAGALSLKAEVDVLLIDGDFRRSSIPRQLSLSDVPGLSDVLAGDCLLEDAIVRAEQFPNFYILPAGTPRENPSDLLESPFWSQMLVRLKNTFRYIVVDSAPIDAVSEYDLLLSASDGVIMVGRPDHTKLREFLAALKTIPTSKFIGVVMNCVSNNFLSRPYSSYDYPHPGKRTR